jgi:hypothetical protein
MFDALTSAYRRDGYHGCAFIKTAAESAGGSDVHARTVEHKAVVRAWVADLARRAGAGGRPGPRRCRLPSGTRSVCGPVVAAGLSES